MTNIGHFRAAGKVLEGKSDIPTRLWIAPPTKMDAMILNEEGYYAILGKSGARMEMPGCSAVHGQPGADQEGQHGDVDLDAQLPQPPRHRHPRLPRLRPNWPP
jgi:aconitase B